MVPRVPKQEGIRRYGAIPHRAQENGAQPGLPEVAPGEDRAPTRGAARRRHQRVGEEHPFAGDAVEVRSIDQRAERALALVRSVRARVAAPVVGEGEEEVRSPCRLRMA